MSNRQAARHTRTKAISGANYSMSDVTVAHPNEFDLRRISRMLAQRVRYRYVEPEVQAMASGYQIVSPCCSRNIDASGGTIDIARLEYGHSDGMWRLYHKDHTLNEWQLYSIAPALHMLVTQLNEDPLRVFWQ